MNTHPKKSRETENFWGEPVSLRELNLHSGLLGFSNWTWTLSVCGKPFKAGYQGGTQDPSCPNPYHTDEEEDAKRLWLAEVTQPCSGLEAKPIDSNFRMSTQQCAHMRCSFSDQLSQDSQKYDPPEYLDMDIFFLGSKRWGTATLLEGKSESWNLWVGVF